MKTALVFSTKYGSTEKVAKQISEKLNFSVDLINLQNQKTEINNYDAFIIGLPVLAENTTIEMRRFIGKNFEKISGRIIGVFILCWNTDKWKTYMEKIFKSKIPDDCITTCVGGEFNFDKMADIEKSIVKDITGINTNDSTISEDAIERFAERVNQRMLTQFNSRNHHN